MPAIVGVVQVISIGSSGILNIGDVYKLMPISNAKTFSGAVLLILVKVYM